VLPLNKICAQFACMKFRSEATPVMHTCMHPPHPRVYVLQQALRCKFKFLAKAEMEGLDFGRFALNSSLVQMRGMTAHQRSAGYQAVLLKGTRLHDRPVTRLYGRPEKGSKNKKQINRRQAIPEI
jgi:hypothetical protein